MAREDFVKVTMNARGEEAVQIRIAGATYDYLFQQDSEIEIPKAEWESSRFDSAREFLTVVE